ncbi:MAG: polyprenyl synthetase family protein [Bdellovibrionales bacterium]|nr:polyprenyl synthetase family protein [Massilia sp.]
MLTTNALEIASSDWTARTRLLVDSHLDRLLSPARISPVSEAMRYSVLAPGKRVRPLLTLVVSDFLGSTPAYAMHVACAIEMIHSASLILDDLPCMDNDRERRNRLSTHVKFGESLAILAAVSLLTQSYRMIASDDMLPPDLRLKLVQLLCETVGPDGLSLGQYIDLHTKSDAATPAAISDIHHLKTGILFIAAAKAGALIGNASPSQQEQVIRFATNLGLSFQLLDDLKDSDTVGVNMVTRIGVPSARRKVREYFQAANLAIEGEKNAAILQDFAGTFFRQI